MPLITRTFAGLAPPIRQHPDDPFPAVRIYESATVTPRDWALREEQQLDPLDTDATKPIVRTLTTDLAELVDAVYGVAWVASSGAATIILEVLEIAGDGGEGTAPYTPTSDMIAARMMRFTRDQGGNLTGDFSDTTEPTITTIRELTTQAVGELLDLIDGEIPDRYADDVQRVAAIRVVSLALNSLDEPDDVQQRRYDAMWLDHSQRLAAHPWDRNTGLFLA